MKIAFNLLIIFFLNQSIQTYAEVNDPPATIRIKAVGDIMMGTLYPKEVLPPDDGAALFKNIKDYLKDSDILMGNFEGTFVSTGAINKDIDKKNLYAFNTPLHYIEYLKDAGFNVMNVANNHAFDFKDPGFKTTIKHFREHDINVSGLKDKILSIKKNDLKIAIIGFYWKPFFNDLTDTSKVKELINEADKEHDLVIVTFHGGTEGIHALHIKDETEFYGREERGNTLRFAHIAIESGADIVIGHGPHVPRAIEFYKSKLIVYSLGNFCTYGRFNLKGPRKNSFILDVTLSKNGDLVHGKIVPVILKYAGIPYYDHKTEIFSIINEISGSDFPQTGVSISDIGLLIYNK